MTIIVLNRNNNTQVQGRFAYNTELLDKINEVKGRNWHPDTKCWHAPDTKPPIELLCSIFSK